MGKGFFLSFPLFVKWNITGRCNLRCRHCFLSSYDSAPGLETVRDTIAVFKENGIASVVLTGGEPLLRPDIAQIVGLLARASINVGLASNGTLLTPELAKALADRGLKRCQISLDGHTRAEHERVRGKGTFKKALAAVSALKTADVHVTLGHTLNTKNAGQAVKMIQLAESLGADTLRYELFLPVRKSEDSDLRFDTLNTLRLKKLLLSLPREHGKLSIELPCFLNRAAAGSDASLGCGAGTTSCVLNSDLSLAPCDLLSEKERTAPMRAAGDFGRLWREDKVFEKWRNISVSDGVCAACAGRDRCGYGCRASALAYGGDFNSRDPLCILSGDASGPSVREPA